MLTKERDASYFSITLFQGAGGEGNMVGEGGGGEMGEREQFKLQNMK